MGNNLSHNRGRSIFWAIATVICMIVIFIMSHQPADTSSEMSGIITRWLVKLGIGENSAVNVEIIVRKGAHMLEYFGLCFCMGMHVRARRGRLDVKSIVGVLILCVVYAISDEVHQLFIEGRAGQIRDVLIDTIGVAASLMVLTIFDRIKGCRVRRKL